ncbi:hypothetical protein CDO28_18510 [Sinorhizobium meliloti]|uniref:hypothetical protein n=1 Tax=Rhizobium meliloti TaxID=382 RepID=UPI000B4A242E|nr:hypothetical protein [Sinorhizobium meliloti]ASP73340.1 hypothetical protein CDO28_18510 [Sinorhizobium meliloti]MDE3854457.1 hypothetical protein [Sinorhizobium meliloti]MQW52828.1 hypothetical protein [Sinorhizobium meliloti]
MDAQHTPTTRETEYLINDRVIDFGDCKVSAREALTKADLIPTSEYQLILVRDGRTKLFTSDDEIDLKKEAGGFLRAFRSDRSFSFTVDEVAQVWGEEAMEVEEFMSIWTPPQGHDWVLEQAEEPDIVLRTGGTISFGPKGVEDIISRPHHSPEKVAVTVFTTSGTYPSQGALRVRTSVMIADVLAKAAEALSLADTSTWIVTIDGTQIAPSQTFEQAGLHGEVELEWGAPEGGGGNA